MFWSMLCRLAITHQVSPKLAVFIRKQSTNNTETTMPSEPKSESLVYASLKEVLASKIPAERERIKNLCQKHGNLPVGDITIDMLYRGQRGMIELVTETSTTDPNKGVSFRGYSIAECRERLPKAPESEEPLPEAMFWLLVTGEIPTEEQASSISKEWAKRASLPSHVVALLYNLPANLHPMAQLSAALTVLHSESEFAKVFNEGIHRTKDWEYVYEDVMNLLGKLPVLAATIYCNLYKEGKILGAIDPNKGWSSNFASLLGFSNPDFIECVRLYLTINSDHGGGPVSAHTVHLAGSALCDPYVALAAGISGMTAPLGGLVIQEVVAFLKEIQDKFGYNVSNENLHEFVKDKLSRDAIIPGYGHIVLRKTDPRYICLRDFASAHLPHDSMFQLTEQLNGIVPPLLMQGRKVKNPWPNVDALSGVVFQHYGLVEKEFYTVLRGMSRAIGTLASLLWNRALMLPVERPKAVTTKGLQELVNAKK